MGKITKTLCIDFDGVIHKYSKGFYNGKIYDKPIEGAFEAIEKLLHTYNVVIFSTRLPNTIHSWLIEQDVQFAFEVIPDDGSFEWTKQYVVGITNRKLKAMMYIDDRAIRFTNWKDILNYVR